MAAVDLGALAWIVGVLVYTVIAQARTIRSQREALDITTRAVGREHAAAEILQAELKHLTRTAQVISIWRNSRVA